MLCIHTARVRILSDLKLRTPRTIEVTLMGTNMLCSTYVNLLSTVLPTLRETHPDLKEHRLAFHIEVLIVAIAKSLWGITIQSWSIENAC